MKLNKEDREKLVCDHYLNRTLNTKEITKIYKIYPNEIYKILKKHDIELRGNRLDVKKSEEICELYKKGNTIKKIHEITGIGVSSIQKQLTVNNIKTRKNSKRYGLDDSIFECIDSSMKAQFLGLIYADGTISSIYNLICIRLREDDKEYLDDWRKKLLKTDKPLAVVKDNGFMVSPSSKKVYKLKYRAISLDITSKKIYNDALKIGLKPRKTIENLHMPKIDEKFIPSFILGLFEGDGSIVSSTHNTKCLTIACQSNMAGDIKNYFDSVGIRSFNYTRKNMNIIQVSNKKDLIKIYDMFYSNNPNVYMKRKKKKFQTIVDSFFNTPYNQNYSSFLRTTSATNLDEYKASLPDQFPHK
jgi:hypothetical protein